MAAIAEGTAAVSTKQYPGSVLCYRVAGKQAGHDQWVAVAADG